jgi:hypothetical protein
MLVKSQSKFSKKSKPITSQDFRRNLGGPLCELHTAFGDHKLLVWKDWAPVVPQKKLGIRQPPANWLFAFSLYNQNVSQEQIEKQSTLHSGEIYWKSEAVSIVL